MRAKSYRDLEVYQLAYEFAMKIHHMSLKLPKYELYEEKVVRQGGPQKELLLALWKDTGDENTRKILLNS